MRIGLIFILSLFSVTAFSQLSEREKQIDSLVNILWVEQAGSTEFPEGIFPSYRIQSKGKTRYADDNIFFSGIIAMRLMRHENKFPASSRKNVEIILENVRNASKAYENKYGRISYNFWQTKPVKQFPGDKRLEQKTSYHIPDDADDSAILFLVNNKSKDEAAELKKMMDENIPGKKRKIRNTLPKFKSLPTYSTWLGDRMPPEFDFCVLANILYVFNHYGLLYTSSDWATLSFLRESFADGYMQKKPHRISPQYKTEAACLYHLAFLVSAYSVPGMDEIKPAITKRIHEKLLISQNKNEALLLTSALTYMGEKLPNNYQYPSNTAEFPFFYANLSSVTPNPFNGMISKSKAFNFPYSCKAWNVMLELEIALLSK